jgi:hypothetical protein
MQDQDLRKRDSIQIFWEQPQNQNKTKQFENVREMGLMQLP